MAMWWQASGRLQSASGVVVLAGSSSAATLALASPSSASAALGLLGLLAAIPSCRLALSEESGRSLLPMLKASGRAQLLVGALLAIGLAL